jgi:TIR domain-containing protein
MTGKIFINYRRGEDAGHTGRLFDRLQDEFGQQQLFMDVDNIAPGLDFVRVLNERVAECDVVLTVIGKGWVDARDATGTRRLDDPDDFVRIEIESALNQGKRVIPVLVNDAPMPRPEDLPEPIRPLARRNAVRLTHERFRSDTQGLIKALQQSLDEIEAHRREAEAARHAEEAERKRIAEHEAQERAAAERRREEALAKQRAEEERAFADARRTGTVLALDAFLVAYPAGFFAAEAHKLKAVLVAREDAYHRTSASIDPAVLGSFIATYHTGPDVDQVRRQLRRLGAQQSWQPPRPAILVPSALAVVLIAGAALYWFEIKPSSSSLQQTTLASPSTAPAAPAPNNASSDTQTSVAATAPASRPDQVAWVLLKETTDEAALKRFTAQYPDSLLRADAQARIAALEAAQAAKPTPPSPDEVTWLLLKDTTDEAALKRFIAQYPNSPLLKDAQARIAALAAADAARPVPVQPDQIAWAMVKDSRDADQLRRFVEQFPNSAQRADAEKRIAALAAEAAQAAAASDSTANPQELARSLQFELKRVGCFNGDVNGQFDDATKAAWHSFIKLAAIRMPDDVSADAIKAVRGVNKRVCPLQCPAGQHADGEQCIANPPAQKSVETAPARPPARPSNPPAAAPRGGGRCFAFQGRQFCE